jgi:hypothetical protein
MLRMLRPLQVPDGKPENKFGLDERFMNKVSQAIPQ